MIDKLFDFLLEEYTQFMRVTYLNLCNMAFRKHPDSYVKACILFEQYALQHISLDFDKKGIRVTGLSLTKDFKTKTHYAPIEVFYKISSGSSSIAKLIMAYNRISGSRHIFSIENDLLIIKGNINQWIDIEEIGKLEVNDVLDSSVNGGEDKLKELIVQLNRNIIEYNEALLKNAIMICDD